MARKDYQRKWAKTDRGRTYNNWCNIMRKCYDPKHQNYSYYGGRGIGVDARWHNFEQFYADMGPTPIGLTLERADNALGYSPNNCQWADRRAQARNRRSNRLITFAGKTQCLMAWSEETGIKHTTILMRLAKGWSVEWALVVGGRSH